MNRPNTLNTCAFHQPQLTVLCLAMLSRPSSTLPVFVEKGAGGSLANANLGKVLVPMLISGILLFSV